MSLPYYKKYAADCPAEKLRRILRCRESQLEKLRQGMLRLYVETHMQAVCDFIDNLNRLRTLCEETDELYRQERKRLRILLRHGELTPQQLQDKLRPMTEQRKRLHSEMSDCKSGFLYPLFVDYHLVATTDELRETAEKLKIKN